MDLESKFPELFEAVEESDSSLVYSSKFREFGFVILNGPSGTAQGVVRLIYFCPFTGKKLPETLRDEWFEEMERLGIDPWEEDYPEEYRSDEWWRKRNI